MQDKHLHFCHFASLVHRGMQPMQMSSSLYGINWLAEGPGTESPTDWLFVRLQPSVTANSCIIYTAACKHVCRVSVGPLHRLTNQDLASVFAFLIAMGAQWLMLQWLMLQWLCPLLSRVYFLVGTHLIFPTEVDAAFHWQKPSGPQVTSHSYTYCYSGQPRSVQYDLLYTMKYALMVIKVKYFALAHCWEVIHEDLRI